MLLAPFHEAQEQLLATLTRVGATDPVPLRSGIVVGGGTPGHRWLEVTLAGIPTDDKLLAASEEDIATELDHLVTVPGRRSLAISWT